MRLGGGRGDPSRWLDDNATWQSETLAPLERLRQRKGPNATWVAELARTGGKRPTDAALHRWADAVSFAAMTQQAGVVAWRRHFGPLSRGIGNTHKSVADLGRSHEVVAAQVRARALEAAHSRRWTIEQALVVEHLRSCDHRGSDVRLQTGSLMRPSGWPRMAVEAKCWKW